jgi:SAM-dependent methyltransferase
MSEARPMSGAAGVPDRYLKVYSERKAEEYVAARDRDVDTHRAECTLVLRAFTQVEPGSTVLDLPCGGGRMSQLLARRGYLVTGADVTPRMVGLARDRMAREGLDVRISQEDAECLTFADRSFDTVLCFRLFHHFPDLDTRQRVMSELCRVATRTVVLSYMDAASYHHVRARIGQAITGRRPRKFAQLRGQVADLFDGFGYDVAADHARIPFFRSLRIAVAHRSGMDHDVLAGDRTPSATMVGGGASPASEVIREGAARRG